MGNKLSPTNLGNTDNVSFLSPQKSSISPRKTVMKSKQIIIDNDELENLKIIRQGNHRNEDNNLLHHYICKHPYLNVLEAKEREEIIHITNLYSVDAKVQIITEGTMGSNVFIVKEGAFKLISSGKVIKQLEEGDFFGDFDLLFTSPRAYTVQTSTKCYLYGISGVNFQMVMERINKLNHQECRNYITTLKVYPFLDTNQRAMLPGLLYKFAFEPGKIVIREDEPSNSFWTIKEGEVEIKDKEKFIRIMKKGDFFGETGFILNCPRTKTVSTKSKCVLWGISKDNLQVMVGNAKLKEAIVRYNLKMILSNSEYFKKLNSTQFEDAFEVFQLKYYGKGEVVLKEDFLIRTMIIIVIQGKLVVRK